MNSLVQTQFPILEQTLALRHQLMDLLTDDDLAFTLPNNPSLGTLCRQIGEYDHTYIESFKTLNQVWGYQHDASVETSVAALRSWYDELENELKAVISRMSEEELQTKMIQRDGDFIVPVSINFHLYRESLLIFYAKAIVYLRAMGKDIPQQWQLWLG